MLLLYFAGYQVAGMDTIMNFFGVNVNNPNELSMENSNIFDKIFDVNIGIIALALAAAGAAALFAGASRENFLIAIFIGAHLGLYSTFLYNLIKDGITNSEGNPVITGILVLILMPLTIGYLISCLEFFRGTD